MGLLVSKQESLSSGMFLISFQHSGMHGQDRLGNMTRGMLQRLE